MRLSLYISKSGHTSRRKADVLIQSGKVLVNDAIIDKPYHQVSDSDSVRVNGQLLAIKKHLYFVFNKPKGVTTTLADKYAEKIISEFFPANAKGIYPVGRLDKHSTGLIIFTNDGDFCYKATHPKFEIEKEYLARVIGNFKTDDAKKAVKGIMDEGDLLKVKNIKTLSSDENSTLLKVIVGEGKKRHLRRLFKQLGFSVAELKRIRIGRLQIGDLKSGECKPIDKNALYSLLFSSPSSLKQAARHSALEK